MTLVKSFMTVRSFFTKDTTFMNIYNIIKFQTKVLYFKTQGHTFMTLGQKKYDYYQYNVLRVSNDLVTNFFLTIFFSQI